MSHLVGDERYHDRLTYDGLWENNLYQFFRIVSPKIQFDLPKPFKLEKGWKRKDDTPQREAVREAFTNAIIHCDLMMDAGILRIEKHDDRLCFRNPGLLKLPVETIYRGGNSKARNPKIQNMLRMIGFGENVGSGFPKIIAAWKETNWGEPQLLNKLDVDEVELVLPVPSTKATSDTAPANAPANASVNAPVKLNKTQIEIVKAMINDKHVTYDDLKTIVRVNRSTITRNIAVLKEKGVIRRVGEDKNGCWEVLISIENVV
jgi:predicted HTH transcriptional regulator